MFKLNTLCWICHQSLYQVNHGVCSFCISKLFIRPPLCLRCGLPHYTGTSVCPGCETNPPLWQQLISVTNYQPPLSQLIYRFKFLRQENMSHLLARLILLAWLHCRHETAIRRPDRLISVPLHRRKLWSRGFNQTDLLAKQLAVWLGCQWQSNTLVKRYATLQQSCLTLTQRQDNLRNVFYCQKSLDGQHVAVIDDVVTTGSTMKEICRLLLDNGVSSIQVWCICRTY